MKKKIALLLSLLLLVGSLTVLGEEVKSNKVQWLIDEGWVLGRGGKDGYAFDEEITRAELTKMLVLIQGLEDEVKEEDYINYIFTDVLPSHWANGYINVAASHGYINGYEDGSFKPDSYITYNEAMAIMSRIHPNWTNIKEDKIIWPDTYNHFANKYGILDGVNIYLSGYNDSAIRYNIFEMIYNLYFSEYQISIEDRWDYDLIIVENGHKEFFNGQTWVPYSAVDENLLAKEYNLKEVNGERAFYDFYNKVWRYQRDGKIFALSDDFLYDFGVFYDHYDNIWRSSKTYNKADQSYDFTEEIEPKGALRLVADKAPEGKEFSHWEYDKNANIYLDQGKITEEILVLNYSNRPMGKTIFKAVYKDSYDFTINFDEQMENRKAYSKEYIEENTVEDLPKPTATGYRFNGWYTKDGQKASGSLEKYKDQTLYGKWIKSYQIQVDEKNGKDSYIIYVDEGTKIRDMLDRPDRPGYTFNGWIDEAGNYIDNRSPIRDMKIYGIWS